MMSDEMLEAFMKIVFWIGVVYIIFLLYKEYTFWEATWWSIIGIAAIEGSLWMHRRMAERALERAKRRTEELIAKEKALKKNKKKKRK